MRLSWFPVNDINFSNYYLYSSYIVTTLSPVKKEVKKISASTFFCNQSIRQNLQKKKV